MSLSMAQLISTWSSWMLLASLVVGVISTFGINISSNVKEQFAAERIAANEAETARARESAAQSNERAAEAELKLEQLRKQVGPRHLDRVKFSEALNGQPSAPVEVLYITDDQEAFELSQEIRQSLEAVGWQILKHAPIPKDLPLASSLPSAAMAVGGQPTGVTIVVHDATSVELDAASDRMLGKNWVKTPWTVLSGAISDGLGQVSGHVGGSEAPPAGTIRIVIAAKP
ncbi:hypothetical protein FBZ99_101809 [Rhizobium sp. ERR 1071]|nr:hypothetical protein FBZ99_101809 [Rhizobium sp. ERR1071]